PRSMTVTGIIAIDFADASRGVLQSLERGQAKVGRKMIANSGFSHQNGTAARKIGSAPVAEPTRFQLAINGLWTANFRARSADILLVRRWRSRNLMGIDPTPSGAGEDLSLIGGLVYPDIRGQLQWLPRSPSQFQVLAIGISLADAQLSPCKRHVAPIPFGNRSERCIARRGNDLPQWKIYGRQESMPSKAQSWNLAIRIMQFAPYAQKYLMIVLSHVA